MSDEEENPRKGVAGAYLQGEGYYTKLREEREKAEAEEQKEIEESRAEEEKQARKELRKKLVKIISESEVEEVAQEEGIVFDLTPSQQQRLTLILALMEKEIKKRLESLKSVINFYKQGLTQINKVFDKEREEFTKTNLEYRKAHLKAMDLLKTEIKLFVSMQQACDKKFDYYLELTKQANRVIERHQKALIRINREIKRYNDRQHQLAGVR